jgi:hypothetical protein
LVRSRHTIAKSFKVPVRNWHPISKLAIGLGMVGLVVVWWTDQGGPVETSAVAGRAAQAESAATPSAMPARHAAAAAESVASPTPRALVARVLPPEATLDAMVSRPLFSPDRRPHDPGIELAALPLEEWVAEPEPAAGITYPSIRFVGSIVEDGRSRAIVSDGFNVRAVAIGEEIDGWTVKDIEARRLILALDAERLELTIFE